MGWKGKKFSLQHRENLSISQRGKKSPEHSERLKKLWKTKNYVKKQMVARKIVPNKSEKILQNILNDILPNDYEYVGDFSFILGGRCPDFMNINGKKKLIELYGSYYHNPKYFPDRQSPKERKNHFKKYGFQLLVVWESELVKKEKLSHKILDFNRS